MGEELAIERLAPFGLISNPAERAIESGQAGHEYINMTGESGIAFREGLERRALGLVRALDALLAAGCTLEAAPIAKQLRAILEALAGREHEAGEQTKVAQ